MYHQKNLEVEDRYKQIADEIDELERKLEEEESKCTTADDHVKGLETEVVQVGNSLRTMEVSEVQASDREESYTSKLNEMSSRYQEAEEKAHKYEIHARELEVTLEDLENKLHDEKDEYNRVKKDLDSLLSEIQEMNI